MTALILASLGFIVIHAIPATPLRAATVSAIGEKAYSALFSILSLVLLWAMIRFYSAAPAETPLWVLGAGARGVMALFIGFAFFLVITGSLGANPSSFAMGGAEKIGTEQPARGVFRITRHPVMMGIAIWALAHMLARPEPTAAVLFGSLALTAIGGARLQEMRKRVTLGEAWVRLEKVTSLTPFGAILAGRNKLAVAEIGWWRIAIALAAWAAFLYFHGTIIGIPAMAV